MFGDCSFADESQRTPEAANLSKSSCVVVSLIVLSATQLLKITTAPASLDVNLAVTLTQPLPSSSHFAPGHNCLSPFTTAHLSAGVTFVVNAVPS